ncbi:Antifungal protein ginkbilobin-2 [Forsythia ovata]|uniref:Antifungal protein ginkbilobin-2 n=1 Tax=Forsythia ovata TaxID=205694 RepID=A0ABD1VE62_9LAMI
MVFALSISLLGLCYTVKSEPNTSVSGLTCNGNSYAEGDPFGNSVTYVLFDLMNVTPSQQGFDYRATSPYSTAVAYGHATCNQALSNNDCANCLISAKATLDSYCSGRIGGQTELVDCAMRFENYYF